MELMKMAEETGEVKNEEWRGKVGKMMEHELAAFLSGNPFCRIGCVDEEGWPYVVPCWFEYTSGGFYIIPRAKSAWARYIQKDRRVFLCIDDTTIYNNRGLQKPEHTSLEGPRRRGQRVQIHARAPLRYPGRHAPR